MLGLLTPHPAARSSLCGTAVVAQRVSVPCSDAIRHSPAGVSLQ